MKHLILILIFMPWFAQAAGLDYLLNGVTTPVKVDTATPANSRPYPFAYYSLLGVRTELAADATLAAMSAKLPATLGQKTSANSLAVVMASDFVYPLPTGAATAANQVTANGYLSSMDTKLGFIEIHTEASSIVLTEAADGTTPLSVTGPLTNAQLRASAVPISAASLPLPTGAATEVTLDDISGNILGINMKFPPKGQYTMSQSMPVAIASDQTPIPVTSQDLTATGTIAAINQNVAIATVNRASTLSVQVVGTYTGALTVQGTLNGTNWIAISVVNVNTGALTATIPSAAQFIYQAEIAGFSSVRVIALAAVTGSAAINLRASGGQSLNALDAPLPAGTNQIGTVQLVAGTAAIGAVTVNAAVAKTVKQAAVSVGTTAVRATTDGAAVTAGRVLLSFRLDPDSTAKCYYGSASVTTSGSTRGLLVFPGESFERINDAGDYYIICDTAAQSVYIVEQE